VETSKCVNVHRQNWKPWPATASLIIGGQNSEARITALHWNKSVGNGGESSRLKESRIRRALVVHYWPRFCVLFQCALDQTPKTVCAKITFSNYALTDCAMCCLQQRQASDVSGWNLGFFFVSLDLWAGSCNSLSDATRRRRDADKFHDKDRYN